ncbi:hypothetical protein [Salmonella phage SD-2_S15]|nr:hypothetical protein [Salmonella phage SD-2_S15]WPK19225.1 hypothetical protein [Salmonella phage SD-6_S16]
MGVLLLYNCKIVNFYLWLNYENDSYVHYYNKLF